MAIKEYSDAPKFVDKLAVDFVVSERRHMPLTVAEKRHAAHRLAQQGLTRFQIAEILRITPRTAQRMVSQPPPPMLDIDERGQQIDEYGNLHRSARTFVSVFSNTLLNR